MAVASRSNSPSPVIAEILLIVSQDKKRNARAHWSPLMLTVDWNQPDMRRVLMECGAHVV